MFKYFVLTLVFVALSGCEGGNPLVSAESFEGVANGRPGDGSEVIPGYIVGAGKITVIDGVLNAPAGTIVAKDGGSAGRIPLIALRMSESQLSVLRQSKENPLSSFGITAAEAFSNEDGSVTMNVGASDSSRPVLLFGLLQQEGTKMLQSSFDRQAPSIVYSNEVTGVPFTPFWPDTVIAEPFLLGDLITFGFSDVPAVGDNWLSIAPVGEVDSKFLKSKYLPVAESGSVNISTLGLDPNVEYELRLYLMWNDTRSYQVFERRRFSLTPNPDIPPVVVNFNKISYSIGEQISFTFSGFFDSDANWVAIAEVGSKNWVNRKISYSFSAGPSGSGTIETDGLESGKAYEFRVYFDEDGDGSNAGEFFIHHRVDLDLN